MGLSGLCRRNAAGISEHVGQATGLVLNHPLRMHDARRGMEGRNVASLNNQRKA